MSLPDWLLELLPGDTAATWERLAPLLPRDAYLGGGTAVAVHLRHRQSRDLDFFFHRPIDLGRLGKRLGAAGPFAVTGQATGTLNGVLGETRVQFLRCGLSRPERRLEEPSRIAGIAIASLADLLAMKLNAVAGRAQLRDYFDLMAIEQRAGRTVEEGLGLFLARYRPEQQDSAIAPIILALGYLDDVADDPFLPVDRETIAEYWRLRQPQLVAAIERHGLTPSPGQGRDRGVDL